MANSKMLAIILALGFGCQANPPGNTPLTRYCLTIDEEKMEMAVAFQRTKRATIYCSDSRGK
jgi:hypothetical protein